MLRRRLSHSDSNTAAGRARGPSQPSDGEPGLDALLRAARPDPVALDPADSQRILMAALAAARRRSTVVARATRAFILLAPAGAAVAAALFAYRSGLALVAPQGPPTQSARGEPLTVAALPPGVSHTARRRRQAPRLSRAPLAVAARAHTRPARRHIRIERAFYETTWPLPRRGMAALASAKPAQPGTAAPVEPGALAGRPPAGTAIAQLLVCVTGADTRFDQPSSDLAVTVEHGQDDVPGFAAASGYCSDPDGSLRWTRVCASGTDAAPTTATFAVQAADGPTETAAYLSVEVTTAPAADSATLTESPTSTDAVKGPDDDNDQPDDVVLLDEADANGDPLA